MNESVKDCALYDEEANNSFVELVLSCESEEAKADLEQGMLEE